MKILFQNRIDALTNIGGDSIQMIKTRKHLEELGVEVSIDLSANPKLDKVDIIHLFNIQNPLETFKQFQNAKRNNKKVVVSTIYWNMEDADKSHYIFAKYSDSNSIRILHYLGYKNAYRISRLKNILANKFTKTENMIKYILNNSDLILPNSIAELENIIYDFNLKNLRTKAFIIPNGVETDTLTILPNNVDNHYNLPINYVLQVGRFEPIKNQLYLIKALYDYKDIPLVFVGRVLVKKYYEECVRLGKKRGNIFFFSELPHNVLDEFYEKAKVHILPSFRESPGLVTLEAALKGANCVSTYMAPINEYFKDKVWYCDPYSVESIKNAVLQAYKSEKRVDLSQFIANNFTWKIAAEKTLEAYNLILSGDKK